MNTRTLLTATLAALLWIGSIGPSWSAEAESWEKMVFHLDDSSNARWAILLANSYLDDRPGAKIVIVAYGPGVDFVLDGATDLHGNPFESAVSDLVARGVPIRICGTTLKARDIPRDQVLDEVEVVPSGLTEIARLQLKEGYAYLKP